MNKTARSRMQNDGVVWYVVFVMTGKEYLTQRMLSNWGASVYLPLCRKWRRLNRYTRDKTKIAYPAVAGSLFVGFERGQERWFDIFRSISSVYGVLGIDGRPVTVDGGRLETFIQENRFRFNVAGEEQFMRTYHEFQIGDRVQIVDGPFDGHIVDVKDIKGRNAYILIDLFGTTQDVAISLDKLEKVA